MLIHAFGGVAMSTAGMARLDSVTLTAGSTLVLRVMRYQWDTSDGYGSVPTPKGDLSTMTGVTDLDFPEPADFTGPRLTARIPPDS